MLLNGVIKTKTKTAKIVEYQWLMSIILALRRQRSGGSRFEASPGKYFVRPYLEQTHHKKRLVEWLKV
jgi:hypothetical protein